MAHFLTFVIVDSSDSDPAERANKMMWSYFAREMAEVPTAKCDGFVIGGRYDGILWREKKSASLTPQEFQARYGLDVVKPEDNIRPIADLRQGLVPFAFVTPDGRWHDRDGKTDADWDRQAAEILRLHASGLVVAVDCHC